MSQSYLAKIISLWTLFIARVVILMFYRLNNIYEYIAHFIAQLMHTNYKILKLLNS